MIIIIIIVIIHDRCVRVYSEQALISTIANQTSIFLEACASFVSAALK